jgi:hypothetical protein
MTYIPSPGPLAQITDDKAMLYLGHLTAQAEMALPRVSRNAQIALTWIAAHVAHQGVPLWTARLQDIAIEDKPLGSWQIRARTARGNPERITIERRPMLCEDGRQITALANPFLPEGTSDDTVKKGLESLLDFSVMALSASSEKTSFSTSLRDINGLQISVYARKMRELKFGKKIFLI